MLNPRTANVTILDDNSELSYNYRQQLIISKTLVAVIGFLNANLSVYEGEGVLNFTIGVVQGYLDTSVTVIFTSEDASARGENF